MIFILHLTSVLFVPILMVGLINRTKSIWSGRKGPNLNQFFFDLRRLFKKTPVYSNVSSWIFQVAPWFVLGTSLVAASLCPIVPGYSPFSFSYDFIYFSYLLGLGRVFMFFGALDTGSAFEGMGASRAATFSALIEPTLFFVFGTLGIVSGKTSFQDLVIWSNSGVAEYCIKLAIILALFIFLQVESARIPVDDPSTHLELTMIHEVMVLDHSGPELGAIQYGAAIKMVIIAGMIAALINPISASNHLVGSFGISAAIICALSIGVGLIESLMARIKLRSVPAYTCLGVFLGIISLILSVWSRRGAI